MSILNPRQLQNINYFVLSKRFLASIIEMITEKWRERRVIRYKMKLAKHVSVTLPANPLSTLSSAFSQRLAYKCTCDQTKQTPQRPREERVFRDGERGDKRRRTERDTKKKDGETRRDTNSADPTASSGRFKSRLSGG